MNRTRAPNDQAKRPQGVQKHKSTRRRTTSFQQGAVIEALDQEPDSLQKRPGPSLGLLTADGSFEEPANRNEPTDEPTDPISFWARRGHWPPEYFEPGMEFYFARRRPLSLGRKRSSSATSTTPSDEKPREVKSAPYQDPRYRTLLATKGSFMKRSDLGTTNESIAICNTLLSSHQTIPNGTLFEDDLFEETCRTVEDRNEARVVRDLTPLIVPSAEILRIRGANHLGILIESVNEGWNNSIPLVGARPQPDYAVGFRREAFTDSQLSKLSPFIGDFIAGDQSFFMGTYYMHFPFLTCEVKCGRASLEVADCQNAHSMTLAVRAVTELFRLVGRESEVHRQILAFSLSHDHESVRIHGHYPEIHGEEVKYYRHTIRNFTFTDLDGREKWTAYRFTKNVFDVWMPEHFKRIISAIDQLPSDLNVVSTPTEIGRPSQGLDKSRVGPSSALAVDDGQSDDVDERMAPPGTSFTKSSGAKKTRTSN